MNPVEAPTMQDVQNLADDRDVAIDAVGIAGAALAVRRRG